MIHTQKDRAGARSAGGYMSIEINRARVAADGTVSCEMVFPNIGSFTRSANEVLRIEAEAFAPREPTAPPYTQAQATYEARHAAAESATGVRILRATTPPYDTTLGGQPLPEALQDIRAGGTD